MENAPSSADQGKPDKTSATPKVGTGILDPGRARDDSARGAGDSLVALSNALEVQASKLRDLEVALIGRIADVDDDRRRTATEVRRALDAQRGDIEEGIRRRGLMTTLLVSCTFLVAVGAAALGLFQLNTGDAEIGAQLSGIQEAVARLSTIDTAPLDERLGELDQAVTRLSGDLETKVDERQAGVTDLANRLKGLEETLASQPEHPTAKHDGLTKEIEERQAADADLVVKIEEIHKAQERLGKDLLLLRDSLANTLASANMPLEQKSWTPEDTGSKPAMVVAPVVKATPVVEAAATPPQAGPKDAPVPVAGQVTLSERQQVLQLISLKSLEDVRRFSKRTDMPARVYYREESRRGKPWFVLFYGLYKDQAAATEAKDALPTELTALKPIIRQLDTGTQLQVLERAP
jgi:DamX protein